MFLSHSASRMTARRPLLGKNCPMFTITTASGEVNAWSEARLPFQPKGEMLEFRHQLAAAIRAMPPTPGAHLVATYTAADPTALIDTENLLFYNVGLGCFSAHTRTGLAFERVFRAPAPPPTASGWTAHHHHRYRLAPAPSDFERWRPVRVAAEWCDLPITGSALRHPETVWAALGHIEVAEPMEKPLGYYALCIRLAGAHLALVNIVKPLIDGVVSALHTFAGQIPDLVVERLALATKLEVSDVRRRLWDQGRAVLGARQQLIRLTPHRIAWNPRDADCIACLIELTDGDETRMTGAVYAVVGRDSVG
jgi:hypothetical protein